MAESLRSQTIKGTAWSFVDGVLGQGVTFLVGLVLARILTPQDYGILAYLLIIIAVSNSFVDSGFSSALIRKQDASDTDYNTAFLTNLGISFLLVAILYAIAPWLSTFFNVPGLVPLIRAISWIIVINALALVQRTILVKKVNFKTLAIASAISSLISGAIGIFMALRGFGVWSLVGQQIARQLIYTGCLWLLAKWRPRLHFSIASFRELFDFGWKLLVSGLINTIWEQTYQLVIGKCYTPKLLGQYTRAYQFGSICSSNLTAVVQKVSYPVLSKLQNDKERLKEGYKRIIKVTMLITFVLMLGLAATAKAFIVVTIGDKWLPAVPMLQIICLQMMLYPLHALNLNMLQVQGRSDLFLRLEIIKKIIAVGPLLLGVFVGIYWMLAASVVTGIIAYYLNAMYSGPYLHYSIWEQVKDVLPAFIIAAVMAAITYAVTLLPITYAWAMLLLQIGVGAAVTLLLCRVTNLQEYIELKRITLSAIKRGKKHE